VVSPQVIDHPQEQIDVRGVRDFEPDPHAMLPIRASC
jgi:hypothetical protein